MRIVTSILACLIAVLAAISPLHAQESPQALRDAFVAAVKAGDAEELAQLYAPDAVTYPIGAMTASGQEGIRQDWEIFLSASTVQDLVITQQGGEILGDTAVAWGLWTMTILPEQGGDPFTMEARFMDVSKKVDGKWRYVADHASVPLSPSAE